MPWSYTIPAGLRRRLDAVLSQRNVGSAEIWGEIRDWLVENGVEMPEHVRPEPAVDGTAQRDQ